MWLAQLITNAVVTLVIGGVGVYIANSFRLQTRIKLLEVRVEAYRKLFALTEITSPTRLGRGESLSPEEAKVLGKAIYDWYYENGNGLLMPDRTRLRLQSLQQKLQGAPQRRLPDDPLLREVAHFRHALRRDIGVFASDEPVRPIRTREWRHLGRRVIGDG